MREIRLYGSEGGGMSNHLSLPLSGQSLRVRKAGLAGSLAHPFQRKGEAMSALGRRSPPPATLTLGRKHIKDFANPPGLKILCSRYFQTEGFHLFAEASWVPAAGCLL